MSALHNNPFLLASGSPTDPTFPVQRSVRLRSSASAYFSRTQTTTTNSVKCTFSGWVKRGTLGVLQVVFGGYTGTDADTQLYFDTTNQLKFASRITNTNGAPFEWAGESTAVFRDPSAWYHIVVTVDTSTAQATNNAYYTVYVNNVAQTFTTVSGASLVSAATVQNRNTCWNVSGYSATLGRQRTNHFDGYLTEVNFIDGQALTPSSFGGYNTGTGVWEPRKYAGTYGTNGFYLNFQDNSAATAVAIGKDSSGNGNNWTPNNISVTAGVTYDSMLDVPTNTSPTNANFAVLNPLNVYGATITNGNLQAATTNTSNDATNFSTVQLTSGKWYAEFLLGGSSSTSTSTGVGVSAGNTGTTYNRLGQLTNGMMYKMDGNKESPSGITAYGSTYTYGDLIGVALDLDASPPTITFYKNNSSQGSINLNSGSASTGYVIGCTVRGSAVNFIANFGAGSGFTYTPPTGFQRLNTYNLPDPTIASGDDFHKVYTYTGNGGGLQVGEVQKPASLFNLDRSLRFRASASAFLNKTPSVAATSNQKMTYSVWVKRGQLGVATAGALLGAGTDAVNDDIIRFATDNLQIWFNAAASYYLITTAVFRDPAAWYHIVVSIDTTQATASNRVIVYVNGVQVTSFSTANYPPQNYTFARFNQNGNGNRIGYYNSTYFDGYLADIYLIDGQQLAPTDFGAYDGNYYWTPKAYTGTYGTNGFHLEFEDNSAATAAAIGKDTSGNVNNWTPNGISVTAGATYDSMTDVPTQTSTDVANFATFNPLDTNSGTITNANLSSSLTVTGTTGRQSRSTFIFPSSGKFYFEVKPSSLAVVGQIGVVKSSAATNGGNGITPAFSTGDVYLYLSNGQKQDGVTASAYGASYTTSNLIGVAVDIDAGTLTFYKDNASQGIAYSGLTLSNYYPVVHSAGSVGTASYDINFGQRPFTYTPPTGFKAINSFNVAEVTDDLESPDFVWIKSRSAATGHALFNSVTGVGKYLSSNATTAETTDVNSLIQFNKNGFLLGNAAIVNTSAATYVASAWKGGSATVTNTSGSISSQVRANTTVGFSIVTYTGTGANATVGHGLGVAPRMMLFKGRNVVSDWVVYHANIGNTGALILNQTVATSTSINYWNNTSPTSSVFTIGIAGGVNNSSSNTYVAYCFSEIAGYSKFGSYTGNGSADGVFVHLGFQPRWVMIKCTSAAGTNWFIEDTSRNTYNPSGKTLQGDTATAEANNTPTIDILSNGFKLRSTYSSYNTNGGTYIYAAFAENPFKYALAR